MNPFIVMLFKFEVLFFRAFHYYTRIILVLNYVILYFNHTCTLILFYTVIVLLHTQFIEINK